MFHKLIPGKIGMWEGEEFWKLEGNSAKLSFNNFMSVKMAKLIGGSSAEVHE